MGIVEVWREWAELWGMVGAQELLQYYVHVVRLQEISQKKKAVGTPHGPTPPKTNAENKKKKKCALSNPPPR